MTYSDFELLSYMIGKQKLTEVSTITFLGWVAGKINNLPTHNPFGNELAQLVRNPPMGKMNDETKISILRKLEKAGITL